MATELERLSVLIEANTKSYERAMVRMGQKTDIAIRKSRRGFGKLDRSLKQTQSLAATFSKSFLGGFALGGLASLPIALGRVTSELARLVDTADKLGIGVEALQEYRFAAEQVGVSSNTLDLALQRFTRRLGEAQQGAGELKGIIEEYGIALKDANGQARTAEAILGDLAEKIKGAGSAQEQLRIAFKAFDSEGAALVNLLRQGASGMDKLRESARELGVVTDETARRGKELDDRFTELKQTMDTAFKSTVIGIADAFRGMGEAISGIDTSKLSDVERKLREIERIRAGSEAGLDLGGLFGESAGTQGAGVGSDEQKRLQASKEQLRIDDEAEKSAIKVEAAGNRAADASIKWTTTVKQSDEAIREAMTNAQRFGDTLASSFDRAVFSGEKLSDIAKDLGRSFLRSGVSSLGSSLFGGGKGGGVGSGVAGGLLKGALSFLPGGGFLSALFHEGGVVGGAHTSQRMVNSSAFNNAARMHQGGIAGLRSNEVPAILEEGEVVLPKNRASGAGQSVTINMPSSRSRWTRREVEDLVKSINKVAPDGFQIRTATA